MVKIRVFIPHMDLKNLYEQVINEIPKDSKINIEMSYIFGTPELLTQEWDDDILVARGMTYSILNDHFPKKHVIPVRFSSFDVLDALLECRKFGAKKIALFLHNDEMRQFDNIEAVTGAQIRLYDAANEQEARNLVDRADEEGADVFVGPGTMCGICREKGYSHVHIHTKHDAIKTAMMTAYHTAITLNRERTKSELIKLIFNNSEDGLLAVNEKGEIISLNNQLYRILSLSAFDNFLGARAQTLIPSEEWKTLIESRQEQEKVIKLGESSLYVHIKPIKDTGKNDINDINGAVVIVRNTEKIIAVENKVRQELAKKGLTAKYSFDDIIGKSESIQDNIKMAKRYSKVNSNVLIIGETGTGKELFAHSIHQSSSRVNEPFVAINCAALPENLLESELFGYEPGAFSGASKTGKIGLFEQAHRGTIFLDEIGEISIALQAKLLRVLQEKEIRRIGSTSVHSIDVRVISATNIDIEKQIENGTFRADLYYRLNLLDIYIPPLRERQEDIEELMDVYLTRFACDMGRKVPVITEEAKEILNNYRWRGNVRELRNICERLIIMNENDIVDADILMRMRIVKDSSGDFIRFERKKRKTDIAKELGVSRTTLWRMSRKQKENKDGTDKQSQT